MVFSASLTLLSAGMLTSAAVSTEALLEPFQDGFDWAAERGLSRGTNSLTVLVSTYDQGAIERVSGAVVEVEKASAAGREVVATGSTGPDGRIVLELQDSGSFGGGYWVGVAHGSFEDTEGTHLSEDVRMGVYFTPDGEAHWRTISHKDLEERGGDVAQLGARVQDRTLCDRDVDGRITGCRGVEEGSIGVQVYQVVDGARTEKVVDEMHPREAASGGQDSHLAPGMYDVVLSYKGATRTDRITLLCDLYIFATYDGAGSLGLEHRIGCMNSAIGISG